MNSSGNQGENKLNFFLFFVVFFFNCDKTSRVPIKAVLQLRLVVAFPFYLKILSWLVVARVNL